MRQDRAAYITVGGSRGAGGGVLPIQSESYPTGWVAGWQNHAETMSERGGSPAKRRSVQEGRSVVHDMTGVARCERVVVAFDGRAPPSRPREMVTPANCLGKERRTGGAWPERGQPRGSGQHDRAAVGLDERDAEQAGAAAVRTRRLPRRARGRRMVTQYVTTAAGDRGAGLGDRAPAAVIGEEPVVADLGERARQHAEFCEAPRETGGFSLAISDWVSSSCVLTVGSSNPR